MLIMLICVFHTSAQIASTHNFINKKTNCGYENFLDIPWLLDERRNGFYSITAYENNGEIFFYMENCSMFILEPQNWIKNCDNEYICGWGSFQDYGEGCPDFFVTANFVEVVYECVCVHENVIQPDCIEYDKYMNNQTEVVCGCDGNTYTDPYDAYYCKGVIQYTKGACGSEPVKPCYTNLLFIDLPLSGGNYQAQKSLNVNDQLINGKDLILKAGEEVILGAFTGYVYSTGFSMSKNSNLQIDIGFCD